MNVNELMNEAESAQRKAVEDRTEKINELKAQAVTAATAALDGAYEELEPYIEKNYYINGCEDYINLMWEINAADSPLKLAPFYVRVYIKQCPYNHIQVKLLTNPRSDTAFHGTLGDLLIDRRAAHPAYDEEVMTERTKELAQKLNGYSNLTQQEARETVQRLYKIWPEKESTWKNLFACWLDAYQRRQAQEAAQRLANERHSQDLEAFRTAWAVYTRLQAETLERNRAKAAALQAELNTPYTVRLLTYGSRTLGECGETIVQQDTAYVQPYSAGERFVLVHRGHLTGKTFFYPISLDDPVEHKPTADHITAGRVAVPEADTTLFYAPGTTTDTLIEKIEALGLEPLPVKPLIPTGLTYKEVVEIVGNDSAF